MSEKKRWKLIHAIGYAIPFLLIVYVLSIGPVYALMIDSHGSVLNADHEKLAMRFYYPLMWIVNQNEFMTNIIISYIDFCNCSD